MYKLYLASILFMIGNVITWFQLNAQFRWDWFRDNWLPLSLLGFPVSILFYWGTRYIVEAFDGELWPGRLIAFGLSMSIFPVLTWMILGEGFTTKTIISILLAIVIVIIQVYW